MAFDQSSDVADDSTTMDSPQYKADIKSCDAINVSDGDNGILDETGLFETPPDHISCWMSGR